jgi:hypothetical protein
VGRVLQPVAHLFGDRHEQVVEDFEHHRIGPGADRMLGRTGGDAAEHEIAALGHPCLPARFDDRGGIGLGDDRGSVDPVARAQAGPFEQRRVVPGAVAEQPHAIGRARRAAAPGFGLDRRIGRPAGAARLDHGRFDDQRAAFEQKCEALPVGGFEFGAHRADGVRGADRRPVGMAHRQGGIGAVIAQQQLRRHDERLGRFTLGQQLAARGIREAGQQT